MTATGEPVLLLESQRSKEVMEIIAWLQRVECLAAEFYRQAAAHFADDEELAGFLRGLAADEAWHASLLASTAQLSAGDRQPLPLVLDAATQSRIEQAFVEALEDLLCGRLRAAEVAGVVAMLEFSEWNEFFLYGVGMLRGEGEEFRLAATEIENHRHAIVEFLRHYPAGRPYVEAMRALPPASGRTILLIEQHPAVAQLLRRLLLPLGEVDVVESGSVGLAHIDRRNYDAILADMDMGEMNGIDFYQQLAGRNPALALRCVFFAGGDESFGVQGDGQLLFPRPALVSNLFAAVAGMVRGEPMQ